jgi:RNA polymerase sigma-70 factor (ECF subfamily)
MTTPDDLAPLLAAGRAAWPELALPADAFARYLEQRLAPDQPRPEALAGVHVADLYLACACVAGEPRALAAFEKRYLARLDEAVARLGREPTFVDDVRQAVRTKLLVSEGAAPKIADYSGRGTLQSWVRAVAVRVGLNLLRRQKKQVSPEAADGDPLLATPDPELQFIQRRYRAHFAAAFRAALAGLSAEQRTILRLHYVDGLTLRQIAKLHRVHDSTASRWAEAARQELIEGTRRALGERLGAESADVQSLIGVLESQFHVSLHSLWCDPPP